MLDAEKPVTAKGPEPYLPTRSNAHKIPVGAPFTAQRNRRNNDCALYCGFGAAA